MVFLFILLGIIILILLIIFSRIQINILDFKFTSQTKKHINQGFKVIIKLYILKKIPIIKVSIDNEKINKIKSNEKLKEKIRNTNLKLIEQNDKFYKKIIDTIKQGDIEIKSIDLNVDFGTENAEITAIGTGIISTMIAILINKNAKGDNNLYYKINPIYINQNILNIYLSSIIEIKMIHIINIIYILNKREGVKKYERTSNRRTYGYGYE